MAEVEKNSFIALPGEGGLSLLKSSKLCGLNLERVVRSLIVIIQRGWDQIVDVLRISRWLGGEVCGSQYHQTSGSNWPGVFVLGGSLQL